MFVIARERSDCGNLSMRGQIATVAALPRNDKHRVAKPTKRKISVKSSIVLFPPQNLI